jgi:hypothetical protein
LRNDKGMALVEMMVALIIVMLMAYLYMKFVWKDASGISQQTKKALSENGIKTGSSQGVVQRAQNTVDKYNRRSEDSQDQYESNR